MPVVGSWKVPLLLAFKYINVHQKMQVTRYSSVFYRKRPVIRNENEDLYVLSSERRLSIKVVMTLDLGNSNGHDHDLDII